MVARQFPIFKSGGFAFALAHRSRPIRKIDIIWQGDLKGVPVRTSFINFDVILHFVLQFNKATSARMRGDLSVYM